MTNGIMAGAAALVATGIVLGCGAFGSQADSAADPAPTPPPEDAAVNAIPPVTGEPLVGVFVSSSKGNDKAGLGTESTPWKTLAAAIQDAKGKSLRVIACAEDYPEAVTVLDGGSVYGGYDCSTDEWTSVAKRATVHSPTSPALLAKSITLDTRIDGFEFYSPDFGADAPSETAASSVGIEIHDSSKLTFANALVRAGSAGPGQDGTEGAANTETGSPNGGAASPPSGTNVCPFFPNCSSQTEYAGGLGGSSKCALGVSGGAGGRGGSGAFWRNSGCTIIPTADAHGLPAVASASTAAGSSDWCTDTNANNVFKVGGAGAGAAGAAAQDGADGANGTWILASAGFAPGNGTAGGDGAPGQGGGGGGGTYSAGAVCNACPGGTPPAYNWSGTGGGAGAGGCAGFAGTPGFGGGASIGALVTGSNVTLSNVTLASGAGGSGGKGTLGSAGLAGGSGGTFADHGGPGGGGGHGGYGGLSGNGAPGPSIALAFTGTRPLTSEGTVLQPGSGGAQLPALTKPANQGTKLLPAIGGESLTERMF